MLADFHPFDRFEFSRWVRCGGVRMAGAVVADAQDIEPDYPPLSQLEQHALEHHYRAERFPFSASLAAR